MRELTFEMAIRELPNYNSRHITKNISLELDDNLFE